MKNIILLYFVIGLWSGDCVAVGDLEDNCGPSLGYGLRHRIVKVDNSHALPPQDEPMTHTITTDQNHEKSDPYSFFLVINQAWQSLTTIGLDNLEQQEQQPLMIKEVATTQEIPTDHTEEKIDLDEVFSHLGKIWKDFKNKDFKSCKMGISGLPAGVHAETLYLTAAMREIKNPDSLSNVENVTTLYTRTMILAEENSPLYRLASQGLERCKEKYLKRAKDPRYDRIPPSGMCIKREK